jgi:hypothetical protein
MTPCSTRRKETSHISSARRIFRAARPFLMLSRADGLLSREDLRGDEHVGGNGFRLDVVT